MDTDDSDDDTRPALPGWRRLLGNPTLPEDGPFLAWYEDRDDDEPVYYMPDVDQHKQVAPVPADDRFLKLEIVRTLTQGNRPFLREQAQAVYTWVTSDTTT